MKAIWTGTLSFGLVNIPIRLQSGSKTRELDFQLLHKKDLSPIHYARECEKQHKDIAWEEIVKGFEISKGKFIVLDEKDFEKAYVEKTKTIDIVDFVPLEQIDPIYYEKPYFLVPQKNAEKAYVLLRDALHESGLVGVVDYVLRRHERLGIIRRYKDLLIINQLRYDFQIADTSPIKIPKVKAAPKEMKLAMKLIKELEGTFKPGKYKDVYTEKLKEFIRKKARGQKIAKIGKAASHKATSKSELSRALEASLRSKKKAA